MKKGWMILLVSGGLLTGVLYLMLAYSMIWQPELMEKLIQCAAAIGYGIFGSALLYSCFRILPELRRKG